MTALPIVRRELRISARKPGTYRGRVVAALLPIGAVAILLPAMAALPFNGQGRILFTALSAFVFLYALFAGVLLTADCLSAEKREGTIGLLFLTDLGGFDVVLGKLVSSSLCASYNLIAIVPMLALAQLLGGVTLAQLGLVTLVLLNTLFFSLSAGLFVSSISRDARKAFYATMGLTLLLALGPYTMAVIFAIYLPVTAPSPTGLGFPFDVLNPTVLAPSPILAFHIAQLPLGWKLGRMNFIESVASTHLCGWILLGVSASVIRGVRLESSQGPASLAWRAVWNRWSFGAGGARRAFRAPMLDTNAFYWLAARDRLKARSAWLVVGTLIVLWFWGWLFLGRFMFDWDNSVVLLFLTFLLYKLWVASEVCMRFVEDRQCGGLELILCSPLGLKAIAQGLLRALWRQFGKPLLVLGAFALFLGWGALRSSHSNISEGDLVFLYLAGLIVFVADLMTLAWAGVYQSARRSTLNRALTATYTQVLLVPWVIFGIAEIFIRIWDALFRGSGTVFSESVSAWMGICLLVDLLVCFHAVCFFFRKFRETAALPDRATSATPPVVEVRVPAGKHLPEEGAALDKSLVRETRFRRRWGLRLGMGLAIVLVGLAFWLGFRRHAAARQVELQLAKIRAAGEPVTKAEFYPWLALTPGAPAIELPVQPVVPVAPTLGTNGGFSRVRWPDWPGRSGPLNLAMRSFLERWMAANGAALQLPRIRAGLKGRSLPIDWSGPSWGVGNQIRAFFGDFQSWRWEALSYLETGQVTEAVELTQGLLDWARLVGEQPAIEAFYIRNAILAVAVHVLERMLNSSALSDALLRSLRTSFEEADQNVGLALQRAITGQRCLDIVAYRSGDLNQLNPGGTVPAGWPAILMGGLNAARNISGKGDEELSYYLSAMDDQLRLAQSLSQSNGEGNWMARLSVSRVRRDYPPWNLANRFLDPWADVFVQRVEQAARLRVTESALAVERFRLATGQFPRGLQQLVPEFLPRVPIDPFDGAPLRFRLRERGYVVYSIGMDRNDDQGAERSSTGRAVSGWDITFTVER